MKIYDKKLAYPYFVWMTLFTVVPLLIVVYYAFTDGNGAFTMENLASISGYGSVFARSLLLALIATVICLPCFPEFRQQIPCRPDRQLPLLQPPGKAGHLPAHAGYFPALPPHSSVPRLQ